MWFNRLHGLRCDWFLNRFLIDFGLWFTCILGSRLLLSHGLVIQVVKRQDGLLLNYLLGFAATTTGLLFSRLANLIGGHCRNFLS